MAGTVKAEVELTTIDAIRAQRDISLAALKEKIDGALAHRKSGKKNMQPVIDDLEDQREEVRHAAVKDAADTDELKAALKALKTATKQLVDKANEMKTATEYIKKVAELATKTQGVVSTIKDVVNKVGNG